MAVIVGDEAAAQIAHGDILQPRVEGRADLQSAVVESLLAVLSEENAADLLDEIVDVGRDRTEGTIGGDELLGSGRLLFFGGDVAVLLHLAEDVIAPDDRGIQVPSRIVVRGRLWQSRKKRGLCERQLVRRLAEIDRGCGRHAVGILAEEDLVQIELEDLVLRERAVDAHRQNHLANLAREGPLV